MILLYGLTLIGLVVYSYSQIDLNLTLFSHPVFLQFQNLMIQLGYFNRPFSAVVFVVILLLLFIGYWRLVISHWSLVVGVIGLLALLSYPFLSHDFFNYMFDARIVTTYGQNPYFLKALYFPADTWIRFMHWTHRTYPYGPFWLILTLVPSLLGFGKFVLTLLNFKLLFVAAYVGCCYTINKLNPSGLKFFALNPLILIEGLFSPHLDLVMLFFAILAIYKNPLYMVLSIGIKYATVLLAPLLFFKNKPWFVNSLIIAGYCGAVFQILSRELLPHYFLVPIGLTALSNSKKWQYLAVLISFILLLVRYVPYLYSGQWYTFHI